MDINAILAKITVWALPLVFAIVFHEVAHGWVAFRLGDPTAKMLGRLSLNPIKHIDPVGTVLIPMMMIAMTSFVFGWAKPVPVNWNNLKHPKRDMILVALAGPFSNLLMAIMWALALKFAFLRGGSTSPALQWLILASQAGILINVILMVLNLFPIPPLDGSRVLSALLPGRLAYYYGKIEPYGFVILIALLASGVLSHMLRPFFFIVLRFIRASVGV